MNNTKLRATICVWAILGLSGCADDDSAAEGAMGTTAATDATTGTPMTGTPGDGASTSAGSNGGGGSSTTAADGGETTSGGLADTGDTGGTQGGSSTGEGTTDAVGDTGGSSTGGMNVEACEAPGELITCDAWGDEITWYQALGLGCDGAVNEVIPVSGTGFNSDDPLSWNLSTQFGSAEEMPGTPFWGPREGEQFLVLSSGNAGTPDAAGVVLNAGGGANGNPDNKPLPAPMSPQSGSAGAPFTGCDGVNDCSDSLITQWNAGGQGANDLIWMQFATAVPGGTHGFSFDFAYFSEEFPEWVGTTFNDMFVVWSNSETYTGNLCFVDDQPCTVTALWPTQFQGADAELDDTSFSDDGGTGWFQIKGSAEPGELLQITVAVFDMGDTILDTLVLLDRFAWDCEGCIPTEIMSCGVVDPV